MCFFLGLFLGPRLDGVQKSMNICYKISEREGVHVRVLRSSLLRSSRLTLAFYMAHLERNIHLSPLTYSSYLRGPYTASSGSSFPVSTQYSSASIPRDSHNALFLRIVIYSILPSAIFLSVISRY